MAIECPVCLLPFDQGARLPKVMPCGHTTCLHCLQGLRERLCPVCRKIIGQETASLASNFYLLGLLEPRTMAASKKKILMSQRVAGLLELDASKFKPGEVLQMIRDEGAVRLKALSCSTDPAWAADVLRAATPLLEELELLQPNEEHLGIAHAMPRLRRLFLDDFKTGNAGIVRNVPAREHPSCLETLSLSGFPPPLALLRMLLRAHGGSIKTLELLSVTPPDKVEVNAWIGESGLTALRRLNIGITCLRSDWYRMKDSEVKEFFALVRKNLPNVHVALSSGELF